MTAQNEKRFPWIWDSWDMKEFIIQKSPGVNPLAKMVLELRIVNLTLSALTLFAGLDFQMLDVD